MTVRSSIGSMALKHVKVYGDGKCLFRCIATLLNRPLLLCVRNEGRIPLDQRLESFETSYKLTLCSNSGGQLTLSKYFR